MVRSPSPRTYFAFPSFSLFFSLLRSQCIFSFSLVISFRWLRGVQFLFFLLLSLSIPFDVCFFLALLLPYISSFHFLRSARVSLFSISFSPTVYVYACMSICFSLFLSLSTGCRFGQIGSRRPAVKFILLPCTATMITASAF